MKPRPQRIAGGLAVVLSVLAYAALAYATPRAHFLQVLGLLIVAFGCYAALLACQLPLRTGLLVALAFRLLWLPALPTLSDDYYRFRWDGLLVASGQNPFRYRPDELVPATNSAQSTENQQLSAIYPRLNSPHYYSVYPPVCQMVFGGAAVIFPGSERGAVLLMRLVLLAAEACTAWLLLRLLAHYGFPTQRALWYLLNPLVVIELVGNLHFEALVICFFLLSVWLLVRGRWQWSAAVLGLAAATKLLPLLLLPLLGRRLGWRRFWRYVLLTGATLLGLFAPFFSSDLLEHLARSLGLYFHNFEFNASLYYLLRPIGYWLTGYNQIAYIGPGLAVLTAVGGLLYAWREKNPTLFSLPNACLLILTLYYLLATIVHPWYLTPLVALSVFTRYRYALVWSAMAMLSYATYQTSAYTENLGLVALEYAVVLSVWVYDVRRPQPLTTS
ncbi:glycosyltransferase 87 family protein [Hymenobacter jejuensis]|uniref:DUF2029 domain-containing protein n=1 Tax=Hymenobacter jejuensis TaxID=2502781 RepID=A0A5B8A699_9BACT|nr:glycosyltransferase 87 family protein [Hymenobacter jejuensis]QDA62283.1 DUF2029 domain-containing protein [Hymenobacter jejuensis]